MKPEEIRVKNWQDFEERAHTLISETKALREKEKGRYFSQPLFRGQSNARWRLESTLEREVGVGAEIPVLEYDYRVRETITKVQTLTSEFSHIDDDLSVTSFRDFFGDKKGFRRLEYMIYLRHHGFPSPILDWSHSPYIAAFFAMREPRIVDDAAIFCLREYLGDPKGGWASEHQIQGIGNNLRADKRHVLQQCEYTICYRTIEGSKNVYSSHVRAFEGNNDHQDSLIKFVIPRAERDSILARLDLMNVNAFSLFQNTDSLMETLASRSSMQRETV